MTRHAFPFMEDFHHVPTESHVELMLDEGVGYRIIVPVNVDVIVDITGDDPRYLDWRLYARSDRYYIKKFEDETNLRCHLIVDNSHSMDYGSTGYTKAEYANMLAATLAQFLFQQGDGVGLLTFDDEIR